MLCKHIVYHIMQYINILYYDIYIYIYIYIYIGWGSCLGYIGVEEVGIPGPGL